MNTPKSEASSVKTKMSVRLLPDTIQRVRAETSQAGFGREISLFIGKLLTEVLPEIRKLQSVEGFSSPDVRSARQTLLVKLDQELMFQYVVEAHRLKLQRRADIVEAALILGLDKLKSVRSAHATKKGKVLTLRSPIPSSAKS